jgi:hypothetical protein
MDTARVHGYYDRLGLLDDLPRRHSYFDMPDRLPLKVLDQPRPSTFSIHYCTATDRLCQTNPVTEKLVRNGQSLSQEFCLYFAGQRGSLK